MMKHIEAYTALVEATMYVITSQLDMLGIPYEPGYDRMSDETMPATQLIFPWIEFETDDGERVHPDVVVGSLHATDVDLCCDATLLFGNPYPSIETYRFPWDGDDITVFDTPIDFVKEVYDLYIETAGEKEE